MFLATACIVGITTLAAPDTGDRFEDRFFRGRSDREYLELLEISRRMFSPDAEFQNITMLYTPAWNGFVEGPTWGAWWIQNSYGTTYAALPFYEEPYLTFLQNAQDLWFDQMGDGKTLRVFKQGGHRQFDWVPPDGCLCDAASPGMFIAKQGDGRVDIHDWGFEFTAAGALMQAELLLISRDKTAIAHYLPKLERCLNFIDTRRDAKTNLFLVGPAANLLAPSYAGCKRGDKYEPAYLAGLSITYIAAMDRLIELEKLAGTGRDKIAAWVQRRDSARAALGQVTTDEGYFIKSLDPDGTKHGVYDAAQHGYFEASPNHDAIAFRVVDDDQARRIFYKIASIPGLRRHDLIIANDPSLDDMYEQPKGLWGFGTWVNGGHWSTCEARMILAYYRLGAFDDARRSMKKILTFARQFRMDNPLVDFGNAVYQPNEPINLCYDTLGPPAAMIRGLFEYLYTADGLHIVPHIPPAITELEQRFPIRFGSKKLYLSTVGTGPITSVQVNGNPWREFDAQSVLLAYGELTEDVLTVQIGLGGARLGPAPALPAVAPPPPLPPVAEPGTAPASASALTAALEPHRATLERIARFWAELNQAGLADSYEAAHARLVLEFAGVVQQRERLIAAGALPALPERSQVAADKSYADTAIKLADGLVKTLESYAQSDQPDKKSALSIWEAAKE